MKRYLIIIFLIFAAILTPFWVFGDPPVYFAKDIRGQVVDAETGQALKGVVIVAKWKPYSIGIGHGGHGGSINTIEAATDQEGKYLIPGWGPRLRWPLTFLDYLDPEIIFFKSNYYPEDVSNALVMENRSRSMLRTSDWDGKVIKLKPFKGNDWRDYANKLDSIWSPIGGDCIRDCPHLVLALNAEGKRIKALAPKEPFIPTIVNLESLPFRDGDREFLKRF